MPATPQFGGTNQVPEINLGQPGSTRAGSTALYTLRVSLTADIDTHVDQGIPQQNVVLRDIFGFRGTRVSWRGTLKIRDNATLIAIMAELNQYEHGSLRTSGVLGAPSTVFLRPTRLTDYDGAVLSESAVLDSWRFSGDRLAISGGIYALATQLEVIFKVLS